VPIQCLSLHNYESLAKLSVADLTKSHCPQLSMFVATWNNTGNVLWNTIHTTQTHATLIIEEHLSPFLAKLVLWRKMKFWADVPMTLKWVIQGLWHFADWTLQASNWFNRCCLLCKWQAATCFLKLKNVYWLILRIFCVNTTTSTGDSCLRGEYMAGSSQLDAQVTACTLATSTCYRDTGTDLLVLTLRSL